MKEKYPVLIGHSARACKKLFTMEQVADFICEQGLYGEVTIETPEGLMLISTYGIYLDKVTDMSLDLTDKSIVINEALKRGCEGRLHFTIAHEVAHHIINKVCGANYSFKYRQLPHFEKTNNRYSPDYDEYMANQLAAAILMPSGFVNMVFTKAFGTNRLERIHSILDKVNFQKFCAIAALFGVSKEALAIRLQKKGMLGNYIFAGYESLLDVFPTSEETAA